MKRQQVFLAFLSGLVAAGVAVSPAWAQSAADELAKGVALFNQGQYEQAQDVLLNQVDAAALSDAQKAQRKATLDTIKVAINQRKAALQHRKDADAAFDAGKYAEAEQLYRRIQDNAYAPPALKKAAGERLAVIAEKNTLAAAVTPVEASPPPAQPVDKQALARQNVRQGVEAMEKGQWQRAEGHFKRALSLVPGLPDARDGLLHVRQHLAATGKPLPLIERLRAERWIKWQMVEARFDEIVEQVRQAINSRNFDLAETNMRAARQVLEVGRQWADPVSKYERLKLQADSLAKFIDEEEASYNRDLVQRQIEEARRAEEIRLQREAEAKDRKISQLMELALRYRKEKLYDQAVETLKQVLVVDPTNERARWMKSDLEDIARWREQGEVRQTWYRESQRALMDIEIAKIPWTKDIMYPKNWRELSAKREPFGVAEASETETNRETRRKLQQTVPEIRFEAIGFENVIDFLRDLQGVNIHVNWKALEAAGIERDAEVTTKLKDVRFEKALSLILDDVGAGDVPLAYIIDEGVIQVSTRDDLNRKTVTRVYDIRDLVVRIPDFDDAPNLELTSTSDSGSDGGGSGDSLFGDDDDDDDDDDDSASRAELIQDILELIRQTIEPDSWREAGGAVGALRELNGQLIVTQTASAHRQLLDLLKQLRETRALQVAVEARFISVTSNFLESIGVDLDVIFNQGNAGYDRAFIDAATPMIDPYSGSQVLMPRQMTRLGITPALLPVGVPNVQLIPLQPYINTGMVPQPGNYGLHSGRFTPIPMMQNSLQIADPSNAVTNVPGSLTDVAPAMQIFGSFLDNIQVDFLIRATQADQRTTLLTAPRIVLFNGQRSWLAVLEEQAYVSDLEAVVAENVGAFEPEIDTVFTGTVLDVEATISADRRYVTLTLRPATARILNIFNYIPSFGSVTVAGAQIQLPQIQRTSLNTSVSVPDGGTLLIGGQKLAGEVEIEAGVPLLNRIPILKRAFTNRTTVKDEQTLLVLVKPKIIIQREAEEEAFPTLKPAASQ